ncbi:hypothetical protein KO525_08575 [Psychrosphaera sp. B3R10]|uniref:DUF3718 domain-containing protein n=1 Tax=Psychrosphaera algicola TaxID=3023714 RepID=A0ABT5FFN5_9GAMM|nr:MULTISPECIES: hypothetical protein [unclassified Psychrosphaera]MBU2882554.1 hypothetical protein [Psychrosphaera sp. I2R16]MBU2989428.1 hypothetical protein [Psychrosphaera sp. B3R10]MDC2889417.1 hypothetical protein [Psychrosphaera sp. G1-22]MDO6718262.1 hypothetical protein [Psychrosphaera sp. 1_MG-2023]
MKKLFLAAATLMSANSFAMSTDYKFVAVNDTQVTNLCVIAAEQGISAAKKAARFSGLNTDGAFNSTECNGTSIRRFAAKFKTQVEQVEAEQVEYVFKAKVQDDASQICVLAAEEGINAAIKAGGLEVTSYICNGINIKRFARKYNKA